MEQTQKEIERVIETGAGSCEANRSLLLKNAQLVDHHSIQRADVLIKDGKISQVAKVISLADDNSIVLDLQGMYLMPGGIDVHTHFNIDVGIAKSCDDFFTGTRSAACGGTTTIVDHMGFGPQGCDLFHQLNVYKSIAKEQSVIDYSFHGVIQHIDDTILSQMKSMVEDQGISSFKLYLTYLYKLDDSDVYRALRELKSVGALTTVHPENDAAITLKRQQFIDGKTLTPEYHAQSRPLECEAEAIARMINLAKLADNAPLYIVHLSNGLGLEYARIARQNNQPVWVETCPQYLLLDERYYQRNDGEKFILSPPLRAVEEQVKLWNGLTHGDIDVVATDHCSFNWQQQKRPHHDDFTRCPNGIPGVELRMPLLFSSGVMASRITLPQFVALTSYNPAKLFGLYPQKGSLEVGADADLVIFSPKSERVISHHLLHDNCDYTPYEGHVCKGWPVATFSRGSVVAWDGKFLGKAGRGQFIKRAKFTSDNVEPR